MLNSSFDECFEIKQEVLDIKEEIVECPLHELNEIVIKEENEFKFQRKHVPVKQTNFHHCKECNYRSKRVGFSRKHENSIHFFKKQLQLHINGQHKEPRNVYKCKECPYTSRYSSSIKGHIKNKHTPESEIQYFYCGHCSHKSKQKSNLQVHILSIHLKNQITKLKCPECSYSTIRKNNLEVHIQRNHTPEEERKFLHEICLSKMVPTVSPKEPFEDLKCVSCKDYLSYFPVYEHKETGVAVCGRCWIPKCKDEDKYQRCILYEKLAKYVEFPCHYKKGGCPEVHYPSEIHNHHNTCIFKTLDCPVKEAKDCSWKGPHMQLVDHFKKFHKELVIENNKVELDFRKDFSSKYLLMNTELGDDIFIVDMINLNRHFNGVVYYFGPRRIELMNFTLVLNSTDFDLPEIVALNCYNYSDRNQIAPGMIAFKADYAIGTFIIFESYSVVKNSSLSCFFCTKREGTDVLSCKKGHNVCKDCKTNHSKKCSVPELSINQELQKIVELSSYCKYRKDGCPFASNDEKTLQNHRNVECVFIESRTDTMKCAKCIHEFSNYRMLLSHYKKTCLRTDSNDTIYHLGFDKRDKNLDLKNLFSEVQPSVYRIHDNYFFEARVVVDDPDVTITGSIHHQKNVEKNYSFEIQFIDPQTMGPVMCIRRRVGSEKMTIKRNLFEVANQNIQYKVKILKNPL